MIDPSIPLAIQTPKIQTPNPLEQYGNVLALQHAIGGQRLQGLQIQQAEQEMQDQQKLRQAYQESGGDLEKLKIRATQLGVGPKSLMALNQAFLKQRETLATIDDKELTVKKAKSAAIGSAASAVLQLPPEARPEGYTRTRASLIQQGIIGPQDAPEQYPGDEAMQLHANSSRTSQQIIDSILKERQVKADETRAAAAATQAATGQQREGREQTESTARLPGVQADTEAKVRQNAAAVLGAATDQADYEKKRGSLPFAVARQFPDQFNRDAVLRVGMAPAQQVTVGQTAATAAETARHNKVVEGQGQQRINQQAALQADINLTPEGLDAAAHQFGMTGQMPAMGMGGMKTRAAIINRAAELYPGVDLATNRAAYDANKTSLGQLQRNRDAVVAFEGTALKNLDLFLQQGKKVIDSGSPILNKPLRSVGSEVMGSENIAAFEAARRVAINEIAKVTSNPNLTGQLSDAARKEVEGFIPQNATFAQIYGVARILKQDMANRHNELDAQIEGIKQRIGGSRQGGGVAARPAATASGSGGIPTINTKAEYDRLPSGSQYIDQQDGKTYTKR